MAITTHSDEYDNIPATPPQTKLCENKENKQMNNSAHILTAFSQGLAFLSEPKLDLQLYYKAVNEIEQFFSHYGVKLSEASKKILHEELQQRRSQEEQAKGTIALPMPTDLDDADDVLASAMNLLRALRETTIDQARRHFTVGDKDPFFGPVTIPYLKPILVDQATAQGIRISFTEYLQRLMHNFQHLNIDANLIGMQCWTEKSGTFIAVGVDQEMPEIHYLIMTAPADFLIAVKELGMYLQHEEGSDTPSQGPGSY